MRQLREPSRHTRTLELRPTVEVLADPLAPAEAVADLFEGKRATSWMQRLRQGAKPRVQVRSTSGVPMFDGRHCCADHLRRFDGRSDLELPFETECPGCGRRFRVRLDLVQTQG